MSRLDATAGAFVTNNQIIRPVHFIYMDFLGDPVRANDSGLNIPITGMTQPDLNGTYLGLTGRIAEVSPIKVSDGGSAPVTAKLSGLPTIDDATLALLADQTKWKGRIVRIWRIIWDQNNANQGSYQHMYTGYMVDLMHGGEPGEEGKAGSQFIEITIENYLAAFSQASNRTYLNSKQVRARYGGISDMSLWRWVRDPKMRFPAPIRINRLKFWDQAELDAFDARVDQREVA